MPDSLFLIVLTSALLEELVASPASIGANKDNIKMKEFIEEEKMLE